MPRADGEAAVADLFGQGLGEVRVPADGLLPVPGRGVHPIMVELGEYGWLGDAWLPGKLSLRVPDPDGVLTLEADLVAPGRMDPEDRPKMGILRPPGWHPVRSAAALPIPQLVDPSEGNGLPPSP